MDAEVARTLAELERKLDALERTLGALAPPDQAGEPLEPEPAEPPPAYPGRIVDEAIEPPSAPSVDATEPAPMAPAGSPSPYATIAAPGAPEPPPAPPLPPAAQQPPAPPLPPASQQPRAPQPPPRAAQPPPRAALPPQVAEAQVAPLPQAPEAQQAWTSAPGSPPLPAPDPAAARSPNAPTPPSAAALLRFRERLESAALELTHEYDELLGRLTYAAVSSPAGPTISFARGAPSLDIVDVEGLREAAVRAFDSDPAGTTAYGTSVGYPRLRSWIADHHGVEVERVLVTNGSMQADAFLFEHLVHPGEEVIVERPSYDRTLLALRQRGAQLHAIELEPDGIDTDALGRLLEGGGAHPKLAHIIPNFQNPAGYTLSLPKRQRLLELAAEHGFVVFEDDPYVALRFSGESLPTMISMDPDRVVYASSFSKTVCPGIRVGYLVGPQQIIDAIAKLATGTYISPNMVSQSIVYEFCASGAIDRSIETVKAALAERAHTLGQALARELPEAAFVPPQGGYFVWVTLPVGTDVRTLALAASARGVTFVEGTDFLLEGGENTLRLAYSGVTPEQIDLGVARLAEAYRSL